MALALWLVAAPWLLWVFYAAVMRLKQVRDAGGLSRAQKVFGYLTLFVGLVLDAIVNLVIASVVFTDDVDATASQFTVTLDWGDGTSRGVVVRDPSAPGTFRVIGVHAYRRRGTYTLSAKVQTTEVGAVPTVILPGPTITV